MQENFFDLYFEYTADTECPQLYHRWSAISCIATYLGRDCYFPFGNFKLHPNQYVMLIGVPATRKSTAIKLAKNLLTRAGYQHFAAEKTSKEKMLMDMAAQSNPSVYEDEQNGSGRKKELSQDAILDLNLWGDDKESLESCEPAELCIAADEFNDFIGQANFEFISLLGTLWDFDGIYDVRTKTGKSFGVPYPTINILGGNTPVNFARAFPPETLGQGFLSRLLLVHGEPTGRKITLPKEASADLVRDLVELLQRIKAKCRGRIGHSSGAFSLLDKIYQGDSAGIEDIRFDAYNNRRFTHLLKLSIVCAAIRCDSTIEEEDVRLANTILSFTEHHMPRALGEFGKSKNSDVSHKVMEMLTNATAPLSMIELWKFVAQDLDKIAQLGDIINNLRNAGKIQSIDGKFLPKRSLLAQSDSETYDWDLLKVNERGF